MNVLVDTNIAARFVEPGHAMHPDARDAVEALMIRGHTVCIVPQVCYEFWVVCTRPVGNNGLGLSVPDVVLELANLRTVFTQLDETPALLPTWESLVTAHAVVGKTAHDVRLVAAMQVHGVTHLLTFNDQHFRRFTSITVLTPAAVLANPSVP
jgi:predicted nucleic acid-binding protein